MKKLDSKLQKQQQSWPKISNTARKYNKDATKMKIWKIKTAKFKCTREHILGHDWLTKAWIIEETRLETCWRDRHNLVEIYDVTKMLFSVGHDSFFHSWYNAKVIVRKFWLLLCLSRYLHKHCLYGHLLVAYRHSKSDVERLERTHSR